jgi:hypothetical protein
MALQEPQDIVVVSGGGIRPFLAVHFALTGMAFDADTIGRRLKTTAIALIRRVNIPNTDIFFGPWCGTKRT